MGLKDWINKLKLSVRKGRSTNEPSAESDGLPLTDEGAPTPSKLNVFKERFSGVAAGLGAGTSKLAKSLSEKTKSFHASPAGQRIGSAFGRAWSAVKTTSLKSDTIRNAAGRFSASWAAIREKLPRNSEDMRNFRPQELMDTVSKTFGQGAVVTYLRLFAVALASYFLADTAALFTDSLIPEAPPVPAAIVRPKLEKRATVDEYADITRRNIFSAQNIIPDETMNADPNGPARKSNLPLTLVGTVVLQNELKSIAAIEDKSQNQVTAVRINESLNGKATIKKIEQMKVIFVNTQTGALEYIEIPQDGMSNVSVRPSAVSKPETGGIQKDGDRFTVSKSELDKAFGNLNEILRQARAIPNFENGVPNGYKIIQIQPGSIYQKLGINEGDVLTQVNGEPINDPGKAFQLMNELRGGSGHLEIQVKSPDGKVRTQSYDLK